MGFSDGSGPAAANLELSRDRAELLRQDIGRDSVGQPIRGVALAADGFGEALPMACDRPPSAAI